MTSEEQHYAAKIFLKAYGEALSTIKTCAQNKAKVTTFKQKSEIIPTLFEKNQIRLTEGRVNQGVNFIESKLLKLRVHTDDLVSKYFYDLNTAKTFKDVKQLLLRGIEKIEGAGAHAE